MSGMPKSYDEDLSREPEPSCDEHYCGCGRGNNCAALIELNADFDWGTCQWFAKCDEQADRWQDHPALGDLQIGPKCAAWIERMRS